MKKYLFYFAVFGWLLSLVAHLMSLADMDISDHLPFINLLHVGIFIVWIPVVLDLRKNEELKVYQESGAAGKMNPFGFYKILVRKTPKWIAVIAAAGLIYAFVNFLISMTSLQGQASMVNGRYVLENHGAFIRNLTEQEYLHINASHIRLFSGHWIAFYGMAVAVLFPYSGLVEQKS